MKPDAAQEIRAVCREWAEDSKEPFVTLVARRGVIVVHEAFGRDPDDRPLPLDFRWDVASITKSTTGILFSQFLDQGLLRLDDPVAAVFPDYPADPAHVPTFRQCFNHMSGLSGHGSWGGVHNPHYENLVLNGIDANLAGKTYEYSGDGYELAAKAMEIVAGKSAVRLYHEHLFGPLGMGDVPTDLGSSGTRFTARELAILGQWVVNHGSYGDREFISPETFQLLLPEPYALRYPGVPDEGGIGIHWKRPVRPGAPADSTRPQDLYFGLHTLGHGSLTSCIFFADLDHGVVVSQIRKTAGPRYAEWSLKFFQAISDGMLADSEGSGS
jgi:CubicO group peptidase (beta-lactamase class C family)